MQDPDFIQKRRTWGFWEEYYFQSSAFGWFVCIQEAVARHGQRSWQCKVMVSIWIKKESVSNKKNDLREHNCSSLRDVHTEENINWFFFVSQDWLLCKRLISSDESFETRNYHPPHESTMALFPQVIIALRRDLVYSFSIGQQKHSNT